MIEVRGGQIIKEAGTEAMDGYYLTMKEFAKRQGIAYSTVRQWKHRGKIVTLKLDGRDYIDAKVQICAKKAGRPVRHQGKYA